VGDSAEDLFSADPVLGEVDLRWPGVSLSRRELAKGTVRPGRVVVAQVRGQHLAQMELIHAIDAEAATDGIYVIRTPVPEGTLDAPGAVAAYKDLANLERDFRHIKADDLDLRPIWHRLEDRVRATC
jgi:hypothetical protein